MDSHSKRTDDIKSKSRAKKLLNFCFSLFGKKTKKSFASVISHVVEAYEKEGLIGVEEKKMFKNIAGFGDKKVSSIMTPRGDIIAIAHDASLEDLKRLITLQGHTRIPVFCDNVDEVVGFIHSKDLAKFLCETDAEFSLRKILRKILFVPGSMKLTDLMLRMRNMRVHIAIVLDEFGAVDGLVTIENLMEEIFGDIEDEHDSPDESSFFRIKKVEENLFQIGGRVGIKKIEEVLQIKIKPKDQFETAGGLALSIFKRVPEIGDEMKKYGLNIKIIDADNRSVKLLEVSRHC